MHFVINLGTDPSLPGTSFCRPLRPRMSMLWHLYRPLFISEGCILLVSSVKALSDKISTSLFLLHLPRSTDCSFSSCRLLETSTYFLFSILLVLAIYLPISVGQGLSIVSSTTKFLCKIGVLQWYCSAHSSDSLPSRELRFLDLHLQHIWASHSQY